MPVLVADISEDLKEDIDFCSPETALRGLISYMLRSYHAPTLWAMDPSVTCEIKRSDIRGERRTLESLVVESPVELPGVSVSLHFNERYSPDDTMTFDFLRLKLNDGNLIPLERLYEVMGRREITFQPERGTSFYDAFDYNHLMDCLLAQREAADLKVKRSSSRMLVWKPDTVTTERYIVSVDRLHLLVPEHLETSEDVQVSEGWSAVRLSPRFESDGQQQRIVHLSVSDDRGFEVDDANAVRFYVANYAGFTGGWGNPYGEGGMIVHTSPDGRSHLNQDRYVVVEARNKFFSQQGSRMFPAYDELLVPLPRFWRMTRNDRNNREQFERIVDYLSDTLTYVILSSADALAQSQVRFASFAYGLEDLRRSPLAEMVADVSGDSASPEEVVARMRSEYEAEQQRRDRPLPPDESPASVVPESSPKNGGTAPALPEIISPPSEVTSPVPSVMVNSPGNEEASVPKYSPSSSAPALPEILSPPGEVTSPVPLVMVNSPGNEEVAPEEASPFPGQQAVPFQRPSRLPWIIAGAASLVALVAGSIVTFRSPEVVYVFPPAPAALSVPANPPPTASPQVEERSDAQGRYVVATNDAPLYSTLDQVLRSQDGRYKTFANRVLDRRDISELTIRASNGNFLLKQGSVGDDGNFYVGLVQVSSENPRREGNPGKTVYHNSTFSNALMLTGWYKAPKSSEEADVIYERVADILHLSFPDQNFTADNLEIRWENLEVYVVSPQKSMRNLEPATNRVIIKRDDVVVMPLEYLAEIK